MDTIRRRLLVAGVVAVSGVLATWHVGAAQTTAPAAAASAEKSSPPDAAQSLSQNPAPAAPVVPVAKKEVELPVELQPYRVLLLVSFTSEPVFTPAIRRQVREDVVWRVDRYLGQMWQMREYEMPDLSLSGAVGLDRISHQDVQTWLATYVPAEVVAGVDAAEAVVQGEAGNSTVTESKPQTATKTGSVPMAVTLEAARAKVDKVYVVSISSAGALFPLAVREWDAATNELSAVRSTKVYHTRDLAGGVLDLVQQLFRPVAQVEVTRTQQTFLRVQGAEFIPGDTDWQPLQAGQLFEPFFRYLNKERQLVRVQSVPWTYLQVETADRSFATCQTLTGMRFPLGGRRRRVETVALGVGALRETTQLSLQGRKPLGRPLPGMEVDVVTAPKEPPLKLVTDRDGRLQLDRGVGGQPLVWLHLRSGTVLLAKLPFVPGIRPQATVELPDDDIRLRVEAELNVLQGEIIETVARRAVVTATARAQAKAHLWKAMEATLKQLSSLPDAAVFQKELNTIRFTGLEAARTVKDRATEGRVQKLCDESAVLIKRYLDPEKIKVIKEELEELRKSEQQSEQALQEKPAGG